MTKRGISKNGLIVMLKTKFGLKCERKTILEDGKELRVWALSNGEKFLSLRDIARKYQL